MKLVLKAFFVGSILTVLASLVNSESSGSVIHVKNEKKTRDASAEFDSIEVGKGYSLRETAKPFASWSSASTFSHIKQIATASNAVESIDFGVQGFDGIVTIRTSKPVKYEDFLKKGKRLDLKLEDVYLPDELQVSRDVNEFASPVSFISTFKDPSRESDVLVVVELKEDATAELEQQGSVLNIRFRQPSEEEKASSTLKTKLEEFKPLPSPKIENVPTDAKKEDTSVRSQEPVISPAEKTAESTLSGIPSTPKGTSATGINVVEGVDFRVKKGVGILTIKTSEPVTYEELPKEENKINLKLVDVFLPDELQDSRKINDLKSPVSLVSTFRDAVRHGDVIVVLELKDDSTTEFQQEENLLTVRLRKRAEEKVTDSEKTKIVESPPTPEPPITGRDAIARAKQENPPITFEKMVTVPGTQNLEPKTSIESSAPKEPGTTGLNTLENVYFKAQKGVGVVTIKTTTPVGYEEIVKEERQLTLKLEDVSLSRGSEIARDVSEIDSPVSLFSSFRETGKRDNVIVIVELKENVPFQLNQDNNFINLKFGKSKEEEKLAEEIEAVSEDLPYAFDYRVAATSAEKKTYRGQLVSFDFKDADVRDVLKILTDISGFNFVVSKDVEGMITLKLNSVPWDKALDVVLESAGLGAVVEGKVIKVTPLKSVQARERIEKKPTSSKDELETLSSKRIFVNYASADKLIPLIRPLLSSRGDIRLDAPTNSLLITDTGSIIKQIEEQVKRLDTRTPKVLIEARVIRATHNFTTQLGVDWRPDDFASSTLGRTGDPFFASNTLKQGSISGDSSYSKTQGDNSLVDPTTSPDKESGGAFRVILGTITGVFDLDMKLSEFQKGGDIMVLSSSNISTFDNQLARIEQVVPITSPHGSPALNETKLVNTNFTFEITPNVTNDKKVLMDIKVTDDYRDPSLTGNGGEPVIERNSVEAQILAMGGETIVVRCLFNNVQVADKGSELFVILRPWIVK
jgi:type IV pilus secretin PilQ/predicted competence protein